MAILEGVVSSPSDPNLGMQRWGAGESQDRKVFVLPVQKLAMLAKAYQGWVLYTWQRLGPAPLPLSFLQFSPTAFSPSDTGHSILEALS